MRAHSSQVPDLDREGLLKIHDYWNVIRAHYSPFEQVLLLILLDV